MTYKKEKINNYQHQVERSLSTQSSKFEPIPSPCFACVACRAAAVKDQNLRDEQCFLPTSQSLSYSRQRPSGGQGIAHGTREESDYHHSYGEGIRGDSHYHIEEEGRRG